jgi:FkbM family methyltransferase
MSVLDTISFILRHPINHGGSFRALKRYFQWQLGSRILPGPVVYNWIEGTRFIVRSGETGLTGNIYLGLHEFEDMAFLLHFLKKDDLFIDVGANAGSYTILACGVKKANGIAIEPVPSSASRLIENIRLNRLEDSVRIIEKGVGDKRDNLYFSSDQDTTNHVLTSKSSKTDIVIEVVKLDEIDRKAKPTVVKIDVEGYEVPVLRGMKKILGKTSLKALIVEMNGSGNRYGFEEKEVLKIMKANNFKPFVYDPFRKKLNSSEAQRVSENNTLFIRDISFVQNRLKKSKSFMVFDRKI